MNFKRRGAETGSGFQEAVNRTNEGYEREKRACITRKAIPGKYLVARGSGHGATRHGFSLPSIDLSVDGAPPHMTPSDLARLIGDRKSSDWRRFVPESKAEPDYGGVLAPNGRA